MNDLGSVGHRQVQPGPSQCRVEGRGKETVLSHLTGSLLAGLSVIKTFPGLGPLVRYIYIC